MGVRMKQLLDQSLSAKAGQSSDASQRLGLRQGAQRLVFAVMRSPLFLLSATFLLAFVTPAVAQSHQTPEVASASGSTDATLPIVSSDSESISRLSPVTVENRLVLSLEARRVYLYRGEMLVSSYPVAVGTDETPTPQGQFTVQQMVINPIWQSPWTGEVHEPGPDSALGLRWIEFATSDAGAFGFHGTPTLESIGKAASNGCVRMRNEDVVALFDQVGVGTSVTVQP